MCRDVCLALVWDAGREKPHRRAESSCDGFTRLGAPLPPEDSQHFLSARPRSNGVAVACLMSIVVYSQKGGSVTPRRFYPTGASIWRLGYATAALLHDGLLHRVVKVTFLFDIFLFLIFGNGFVLSMFFGLSFLFLKQITNIDVSFKTCSLFLNCICLYIFVCVF